MWILFAHLFLRTQHLAFEFTKCFWCEICREYLIILFSLGIFSSQSIWNWSNFLWFLLSQVRFADNTLEFLNFHALSYLRLSWSLDFYSIFINTFKISIHPFHLFIKWNRYIRVAHIFFEATHTIFLLQEINLFLKLNLSKTNRANTLFWSMYIL